MDAALGAHDCIVPHMFTVDAFGHKPGEVENARGQHCVRGAG